MQNIKTIHEIEEIIKTSEKKLAGKGRILVRPSGTEPKIRIMIEGENPNLITKLGKDISNVVKKVLKYKRP